jgi:hypothetical protein
MTMRIKVMMLSAFMFINAAHADNIVRYMDIAQTIPNREMKADAQSQAWARSARNVLHLTNESIAETLLSANSAAKEQGSPLFCLPSGKTLTAKSLGRLIQAFAAELSPAALEKQPMTVSQVALLSVQQRYPCATPRSMMGHMDAGD